MASQTKSSAPSKITNVVHTLLDGLHTMSKSETIIGDPYTLGDATIVPVHRLRVALGAGAAHGGAKQNAISGESGGLGAGGGVQVEPVAVIAVGRDGVPRLLCVESDEAAAQKLLKQLPELVNGAAKVLSERVGPIVGKLVNRSGPAVAAPHAEALPEAAPALLNKASDEG